MKKAIVLTLMVAVAAGLVVAAGRETKGTPMAKQDVEALILKGLKAYKDGKNQDAIQALQQAVAAIQKTQQAGMASFLPAAPAGWTAGKVDSGSVGAISSDGGETFSAINLSRKYTKKGGDEDSATTVTVTIHSQKELIEAFKGMAETYKNPQMIAMMEQSGKVKMSSIDTAGWTGWKMVSSEGRGEAKANAFCGDLMLMVEVNKADARAMELFWSAIDLKGLAGTATMKVEKK